MKLHDFLQKVILFSGKTQVQAANEAKISPPTLVWITWQTIETIETIEKSKGK